MKTPSLSQFLTGLLLSFMLLGLNARAAVIISDLGVATNNTFPSVTGNQQRGVVFTMGSTAYSVDSVILRLAIYDTPGDVALLGFFEDGGSAPGAQVGNYLIAPLSLGGTSFDYSFLPNGSLLLQPNTKYWMILDHPDGDPTSISWASSSPIVTPTGAGATHNSFTASANNGASYGNPGIAYTFQINGTAVPEPSRALLLMAGLGALIVRRRRSC